MASESPTAQRRNKAPRQRQPPTPSQQYAEVQSESNLPDMHTPKSRKNRQRQPDNRAASGSEGPHLRNNNNTAKSQRTRQTPMTRDSPAVLATPAKNLAYASAAFHHSPAASSLPMPKFLSRSVPAAAPDSSLQARLNNEEEKPAASPSPPETCTPDPLAREKSPLDMFFNADRQERANKLSFGTLHPDDQSPSLQKRTPPEPTKEQFMLELDNSQSPAIAPSSRPSYGPRMASAPGNVPHANQEDDATRSLKAFLNLNSQNPLHQPSPQNPHSAASPAHPYHQQSPFVTTTPQQHNHETSNHSPLHYGNRNLSPLFQAVRTPQGSPGSATNSPLQSRNPTNQPQPFDPRAFLDKQVASSPLANPSPFVTAQPQRANSDNPFKSRQYDFASDIQSESPSRATPSNYSTTNNQNAFPAQRRPPDSPTDTAAINADIKDMEAKLRGILKLGV